MYVHDFGSLTLNINRLVFILPFCRTLSIQHSRDAVLLFSVARDSSPVPYAATATREKIEARIASPSETRSDLVVPFKC